MRFITPVILILISLGIFFILANPLYGTLGELNAKAASYNDALGNSKILENERDKLTAKYNAIDPQNLAKLEKFLPENVDNIRLILEIEEIARPYGMTLKDVKYSTAELENSAASPIPAPVTAAGANRNYGTFDLEFSTVGNYHDFIDFTRDLESNLRIVDISSITFSSNSVQVVGGKVEPSDIYKYDFKIKTYWLKN